MNEEVNELNPTVEDCVGNVPDEAESGAPEQNEPNSKRKNKKNRNFEELHDITPGRMSDTEKNTYIRECRKMIAMLNGKCESQEKSLENTFGRIRTLSDDYNALVRKCNKDMAFIQQAVSTCTKTIQLIGGANENGYKL